MVILLKRWLLHRYIRIERIFRSRDPKCGLDMPVGCNWYKYKNGIRDLPYDRDREDCEYRIRHNQCRCGWYTDRLSKYGWNADR